LAELADRLRGEGNTSPLSSPLPTGERAGVRGKFEIPLTPAVLLSGNT